MPTRTNVRPRIMLLISPSSYRGPSFLKAADRIGIDAIPVYDLPPDIAKRRPDALSVDFRDIEKSAEWIEAFHDKTPVGAILSVDDAATELASVAASRLGLPANDPQAALAARDKFVMRSLLSERGVASPEFELFHRDTDIGAFGKRLRYPVVVKARRLTGSRGVIRANDESELVQALERVRRILASEGDDEWTQSIIIESYLPGEEVAVEGLLTDGDLRVLAIFDKPDPLEGPFFEETIYTTPSRYPDHVQEIIAAEVHAAAAALGLRHGPIHAELRVSDERAWLLEVAGRSIGGL